MSISLIHRFRLGPLRKKLLPPGKMASTLISANLVMLIVYFLPTMIAYKKRNEHTMSFKTVMWVNVLLGWTVVM